MSNVIVISGSLQSIKGSLQRIREVVKNREALGFQLLTQLEEWMYITERDERVCYFCRSFEHTIHRGDDIPRRFPFYQFIDDRHIAVNLHILHPFLAGLCRCRLELENVGEVTESQLHREKLAVI